MKGKKINVLKYYFYLKFMNYTCKSDFRAYGIYVFSK